MISSFRGDYSFLSNFAPCQIRLGGVVYPSAEHAFVAAKTLNPIQRSQVAACSSPAEAKRLGRKVSLRAGWDEIRLEVMQAIVSQKFRSSPLLAKKLLATGSEELVEGNTWGDRFWGAVLVDGSWVGMNHLGHILMRVREDLRRL